MSLELTKTSHKLLQKSFAMKWSRWESGMASREPRIEAQKAHHQQWLYQYYRITVIPSFFILMYFHDLLHFFYSEFKLSFCSRKNDNTCESLFSWFKVICLFLFSLWLLKISCAVCGKALNFSFFFSIFFSHSRTSLLRSFPYLWRHSFTSKLLFEKSKAFFLFQHIVLLLSEQIPSPYY